MGAGDKNSPNFRMMNHETGQVETYPRNPSYLDRVKENLTVSEAQGNRLSQARAEMSRNASAGRTSGDAKDADSGE